MNATNTKAKIVLEVLNGTYRSRSLSYDLWGVIMMMVLSTESHSNIFC